MCVWNKICSAIPWSNANLLSLSLKCDAFEIELCGKFVIYSRIHYHFNLKILTQNCVCSIVLCVVATYRACIEIFICHFMGVWEFCDSFNWFSLHFTYIKLNSTLVYKCTRTYTSGMFIAIAFLSLAYRIFRPMLLNSLKYLRSSCISFNWRPTKFLVCQQCKIWWIFGLSFTSKCLCVCLCVCMNAWQSFTSFQIVYWQIIS